MKMVRVKESSSYRGVNYEEVLEQGDSILVRDKASSSYWGFELPELYCTYPINHEKSSRSVEREGAVKMFKRYVSGLHYTNCIGDENSSAFQIVVRSNQYPCKGA